MPVGFRSLSDNLLTSMMNGLIDSDGHIERGNGNIVRENIDTTSYRLVCEAKEALLYLKIPSSINTRKEFMRGKYLCKQSYKLRFKGVQTKRSWRVNSDKGYFNKIIEINTTNDVKKVYDITVEDDHSYLTSNYAVHNSCGGSLIAYLIDIHIADPIKYGLIFARFHNKEKKNYPDVDLDFATAGRGKVIKYIINKYGQDYVAHVSNVNTITPKVYARDIARTFGYGDAGRPEAAQIGNDIADSIPADANTISGALTSSPLFQEYAKQYPELSEYAPLVGGVARAWSTHAGGVLIGKRPLTGLVPVRRDKDGIVAIEYDKDKSEENGLVKMDILGLTTLDIIADTYDIIESVGKEVPPYPLDFEKHDEKAYDLICRGDVFGIFQMTGVAAPMCKVIQPKNVEDIAMITALIRPAAKDIVEDFIRTRNGDIKLDLMHPNLERAFKSTYGFGLYEECLMYIAADVAGWDLHKADGLRKMTKAKGKYPERVKALRKEFIQDAQDNKDIEKEMATKIAFNKCLYLRESVDIYTSNGEFLCSKPIESVNKGEYVRSREEGSNKDIFYAFVIKIIWIFFSPLAKNISSLFLYFRTSRGFLCRFRKNFQYSWRFHYRFIQLCHQIRPTLYLFIITIQKPINTNAYSFSVSI